MKNKIRYQKMFSEKSDIEINYKKVINSQKESLNEKNLRSDEISERVQKISQKQKKGETASEAEEEKFVEDEYLRDPNKPFAKFAKRNRSDSARSKNLNRRFSGEHKSFYSTNLS